MFKDQFKKPICFLTRTVDSQQVVKSPSACSAVEAKPMVNSGSHRHLFGVVNDASTATTTFPVDFSRC